MKVTRATFFVGLGVAGLIGMTGPAMAQHAPSALRGKSIVASWTENRMQRAGNQMNFRPHSVPQIMDIYISTEGRTFERRTASRRGRSGTRQGIGGGTISSNSRSYFRGNTLILAGAMRQGARQVTIEFSPDFTRCSARVIVGHGAGQALVRAHSMISGKRVEFRTLGISDESCSVQDGNIFGN